MGIRWASVRTVLVAGAVALVLAWVAVRGRWWAWAPFLLALGVVVREVRWLQRRER
ncbi:hypothetical protein Xcel_0228 [Xylanimonas cellulosilytica DSM 15894]|uniref:Uncharacterized protein n=1 Tax=Xylanimonas cellulosilytica (strain DSM 15894 / JCM 12276 / CECT 5975 / KCTC 9989 / LMG 20990 / NBRC 107835 / XIL07) TaxID=446471 RepID=D1BUM6_XYLCX|nr:hypothetical protein [Xylanimonas cellulosilytica]ACZ29267.1 hypothetical protein Xcel_0228 [Xylanimonas cellulosilytica DSM 15894]